MSQDKSPRDDGRSTDHTNVSGELCSMDLDSIPDASVQPELTGIVAGRFTNRTRRANQTITDHVDGRSPDQTGYTDPEINIKIKKKIVVTDQMIQTHLTNG